MHHLNDDIKSSHFLRASGVRCEALSVRVCRPNVEMSASQRIVAAARVSPVRGALADTKCHNIGSTCRVTN